MKNMKNNKDLCFLKLLYEIHDSIQSWSYDVHNIIIVTYSVSPPTLQLCCF